MSTSWKKKVELEARNRRAEALEFLMRVYWGQAKHTGGRQPAAEGPGAPGSVTAGRAEAGQGPCAADGGSRCPPSAPPAPAPPRSPHLLDVEGEEDEDAVEQRQQGTIEEAHPGDRLPRHNVQDILGHQEFFPVQPDPERA